MPASILSGHLGTDLSSLQPGRIRRASPSPGAHLLVGGDTAARLEALVARLSLEPGLYTVHWHRADEPDPALIPAPAPDGPPDQG
jgi:hypothetical protein